MKSLIRRQISRKLQLLSEFRKQASGIPSWTRYMRKALNMTPHQLAQKMGIAPATLYQLERQEALDKANFQNLKKAASALECDLVYAFIPKQPIEEIINQQAYKRAKEIVLSSHLQMEYEDQAVSEVELNEQIKDLMEQLKNSKNLWKTKNAKD